MKHTVGTKKWLEVDAMALLHLQFQDQPAYSQLLNGIMLVWRLAQHLQMLEHFELHVNWHLHHWYSQWPWLHDGGTQYIAQLSCSYLLVCQAINQDYPCPRNMQLYGVQAIHYQAYLHGGTAYNALASIHLEAHCCQMNHQIPPSISSTLIGYNILEGHLL